jgi:hypothetical protein
MGKLSELLNKGARLIVTEAPEGATGEAEGSSGVPRKRERDISPDVLEAEPPTRVTQSRVAAGVEDFAAVYEEAGITMPTHGYGIEKVSQMLQNPRFASLSREAKANAVLVALEAAGAPIREVIQDAVQRDKALDGFEAAKEHELLELRAGNDTRIQALNQQLEELIQKINAEVQTLKQASEEAERAFAALRTRKRREEERLRDLVAFFIEGAENPISTTGTGTGAPADKTKPS